MNARVLPEVCVVYLVRGSGAGQQVLLGRKLTGLGQGKVVAPGGKLEPHETPAAAAVRELAEEVGLIAPEGALTPIGDLRYEFPHRPGWSQRSWAFLGRGEFDEPTDSTELVPEWCAVDEIPYQEMWDDARYWLPAALAGDFVRATFVFGEDLATVVASDHPSFPG